MIGARRTPRRRQRAVGMIVMTTLIVIVSIVVAFFANTLGYQSTADIALRSALRSGAIAASGYPYPCGDLSTSADDGYSRWFIDPVVGNTTSGGIAISPWSWSSVSNSCTNYDSSPANMVARRMTLLVLNGDGTKTGSFASRFSGSLATLLARDTAGNTRDGLDVEVLNPAVDETMSSCSSLNGSACAGATTCTSAGVYPQGVSSLLDGLCYTGPTVVLRARLTVVQTTGSVTMVRTVAAGAGTQAEVLP